MSRISLPPKSHNPLVPARRKNRRRLIIAIDGPAGSGKSSTAKELAAVLKLPYIDTGAMYRSLTLLAVQRGVSLKDVASLAKIAHAMRIRFGRPDKAGAQKIYVNGKDVTKAIREPEITRNVFYIAREPRLRNEMVKKQRVFGNKEGAVMEGRDIGSVVFPRADFKFYFDATPRLRALRRQRELAAVGKRVSLAQVLKEIEERDRSDRERKDGALKVAKGARVLDTTGLTIEATIDKILAILGESVRS